MPADDHVTKLMTDAITAAVHPGRILLEVCGMLRPKSGRRLPSGRKLNEHQAAAAAMVVTGIMNRLGVAFSDACALAKVANEPKNYYRFHLTREELSSGAAKFASRRFSRTLSRYRDLVVAAAKLGRADEIELLDELAKAVHDFLEPFVPFARHDEFEELSESLSEIGRLHAPKGAGWHDRRPRPALDGLPRPRFGIQLRDHRARVRRRGSRIDMAS